MLSRRRRRKEICSRELGIDCVVPGFSRARSSRALLDLQVKERGVRSPGPSGPGLHPYDTTAGLTEPGGRAGMPYTVVRGRADGGSGMVGWVSPGWPGVCTWWGGCCAPTPPCTLPPATLGTPHPTMHEPPSARPRTTVYGMPAQATGLSPAVSLSCGIDI